MSVGLSLTSSRTTSPTRKASSTATRGRSSATTISPATLAVKSTAWFQRAEHERGGEEQRRDLVVDPVEAPSSVGPGAERGEAVPARLRPERGEEEDEERDEAERERQAQSQQPAARERQRGRPQRERDEHVPRARDGRGAQQQRDHQARGSGQKCSPAERGRARDERG